MFKALIEYNTLHNAFLQVKDNQGCAGVDGITISIFENKLNKNLSFIINELKDGSYSPLPLLKIIVDKGNDKSRCLYIPTIKDRVVQTAVLCLIEPIFEKEFEKCSFGYRKGLSVKHAIYKVKEYHEMGYRWIIDADIDIFFDNLDHRLLFSKIERYIKDDNIIKLIVRSVRSEVWDGKYLYSINRGIPQGSPLSPILANLFLDELDEALLDKGYKYVRYADDFVVLCKSPEKAEESLEFTNEVLDKLLLKLDESDIKSFEEGFKYLGVTFIGSMIFVPFDKKKSKKGVLYFPPLLNMDEYYRKKKVISRKQ